MDIKRKIANFGLKPKDCDINPMGNGLINSTWLVWDKKYSKKYVLQKINHLIFKHPENIAYNIRFIGNYLQLHFPKYLFTHPIVTKDNKEMYVSSNGEYYRLFHFVENSKVLSTLRNQEQAFEAAKQFGNFSYLLSDIDCSKLKISLPDFHNLNLRFKQLIDASKEATKNRYKRAEHELKYLISMSTIIDKYNELIKANVLKQRVTHHDTKVSNILFNENDEGLCVIDLDTTMPGYFISDVGDMFRTYLSAASEEETDISKIKIREGYIDAISLGYLEKMRNVLNIHEKQHFFFSGEFMIYMQAIRFLADYLNGNIYFKTDYLEHNYDRAKNQIQLLKLYLDSISSIKLKNIL